MPKPRPPVVGGLRVLGAFVGPGGSPSPSYWATARRFSGNVAGGGPLPGSLPAYIFCGIVRDRIADSAVARPVIANASIGRSAVLYWRRAMLGQRQKRFRRFASGLSARLLLLTIGFRDVGGSPDFHAIDRAIPAGLSWKNDWRRPISPFSP